MTTLGHGDPSSQLKFTHNKYPLQSHREPNLGAAKTDGKQELNPIHCLFRYRQWSGASTCNIQVAA